MLALAAAAASLALAACSGSTSVARLSGPVAISGDSGDVRVSGVSGPLQVSTGSGNVTATAIRSPAVQMTTNEGDADISFAAAPRSVTVNCSAGNATVRVPAAGHRYHILVGGGTGTASSKVPNDKQAGSVVQVTSGNGNATVLPAS
jgi:DUF4097 and DUF4098 domain-containing protein YvlB